MKPEPSETLLKAGAGDTFEPDLKDFFDNAAVCLHCVGADGTILTATRAELELFGYSREEYIGHHIAEFHADQTVIADILERLGRGETLRSWPARLRCKDGAVKDVLIDSDVRRGSRGEFMYTRCLTRDVTDWKRKDAALRESNRRWRELTEALPAAVYTTDKEGRITSFNQAAVRLSGRVPELHKDSWCVTWKLFRPDGTPLPHEECPMAIALKERRPIRGVDAIGERPDGSRVHFMPYPTPLFDESGELTGAVNMLMDLTDVMQASEMRARLAAIVDSSDDAIVSKSLEGVILSWNRGAERIFGYTAAEAVGRHISFIIPPERRAEEDYVLGKIRRGETVDHFETIRRAKDGRQVDISLTVSPIRDDLGRITGASKIARDITERKRAEKALRESEARLEAELADMKLLSEVSAELIHDQDADALYAKVLDAAVTIMASDFGSLQMFHPERGPAGELQLLACHGFDPETVKFWEWVRADSNCSCAAALRTGQRAVISDVEKCDFMAGTQDLASYLRAGMRAAQSTPLVSRAGNLVGMLSTHWRTPHDPSPRGLRLLDVLARQAADLIERKLAKEALRCRQEALEQADRHKDQFIAMLAHELRNPLSAIRMGAELLDRAEIDDRKARFAVTAITRQATQLRRISDDLLDIARVSHGKLELRRQPINLLAVVKAVVADYVSLLRGNAAIRIEGPDCWADADLARVQQMIGNLIDNAVKYGGRNIAIRVARKSEWSRIMVKDDGQGIAPELLASLFEPFVQGAQPVDGMQGGLGLGLALVDRLASLHGGGIEARSEGPGKGSAFILSLPAAEKPRAARKSSSGAGRAKQRILVVEDEDDSRECLRLLLESDGYDVAFAEDGAHGLAQFSSFRPDVALVDIGLPGMDGYELVRRARRLPGGKEIPIIAITGYGGDKHRQQALKAGFDLHITKPLSHEELMRALATERTDATAER